MTQNTKIFDLEERTTVFAIEVARLCKGIKKDPVNMRGIMQLMGSSGSIGANYREANDSLGKKDFIMRAKTARKEAKETIHWLRIIKECNPETTETINYLMKEAEELKCILSSIINKI